MKGDFKHGHVFKPHIVEVRHTTPDGRTDLGLCDCKDMQPARRVIKQKRGREWRTRTYN